MGSPLPDLRTPEFPHAYYPDHWGPFLIHDIFPIDRNLRPLDVEYYQICIVPPKNPAPIYIGFDDFAPVWPIDPDLSPKAVRRRDKLRGLATFRALVRVKKMKHLSPGGIERLRDAGADVSEAACKEGALVVAVTGVYKNYPLYYPDPPKVNGVLFVQYIHEFENRTGEARMAERNLCLSSVDMRTFARSMLYIERIKLRRFMVNVHKENKETMPVEDRDIEWFISQYMERYPFAATATEKPKEYRGARKHTSEVRHSFVCHAEWLLHHSSLGNGADRVINRSVLEKWAAAAPRKRAGAARYGRDGWGKWDSQWDKGDALEMHRREYTRLHRFISQYRRQQELEEDADMRPAASGIGQKNKAGATGKATGVSYIRNRLGKSKMNKGKGRVEQEYTYEWIQAKDTDEEDAGQVDNSIEEEYVSLDDEPGHSSKRPRPNTQSQRDESLPSSSQSLGAKPTRPPIGWGNQPSSPSLGGYMSSQLLGGSQTRGGPSSRPIAGPSASRLDASSSSRSPYSLSTGSSRAGPSRSTNTSSSLSGVPMATNSITRELSKLGTSGKRPSEKVDVIVISSDDDSAGPRVSETPKIEHFAEPEVIEFAGSLTDSDQEMRDPNDTDEDDGGRIEIEQRSTVNNQPQRPVHRSSDPNRSDDEEQIPDSEVESVPDSSDSESKYKRLDRRPNPNAAALARSRIIDLNDWINKFAPAVNLALEMPRSWAPWHCPCPQMDMPFNSPLTLAHKHKCRYIVDLRKPSDDVIRLLSNSPFPTDAELLKHLQTKPSVFNVPWEEIPVQILKRSVELHWEEHYAVWGVKRVVVRGSNLKLLAHFEYLE